MHSCALRALRSSLEHSRGGGDLAPGQLDFRDEYPNSLTVLAEMVLGELTLELGDLVIQLVETGLYNARKILSVICVTLHCTVGP